MIANNYTLKNGDCMEFMKEIPDHSIDVILTDPPYGENIAKMGFIKSGRVKHGKAYTNDWRGHGEWDSEKLADDIISEIFRVSKNQIIFGGNFIADRLPASRCWLVWDKRKDEKYNNDFADCELAWTNFDKPSRIFHYLWSGMLQENMQNKEKRFHPTQKPIDLMKWVVENYTKENQIILDPFMGSGTTGIASLRMGRKFIGYEIDEKYFNIAKERIESESKQFKLPVLEELS